MGKVIKAIGIGVLLVGLAIVTGGSGIIIAGIGTISQGAILAAGIASVLAGVSTLAFAPKMPQSQISRLNVTLDPSTPRKAAFGTTALNNDLRYHESSGADQEYFDYIIAVAAHKVTAISEIWFEAKKVWSLSGGVIPTYASYLTVDVRTEGTSANTISINGGTKWGSSRRLTGCAYIHLRIKRTGATSKVDSPLVNGLPSRVTIIGNGALLYDPRKDSTVPGGSGTHRTNDQATWGAYTNADDCDNPALQLLWWLLGWKINDKLSIGCGVPASRIDLASFITAANICDEDVTLAIGGTQKRYRTSGTASDADSRMDVINNFLSSMNGTLRDSGGKLKLTVMKNDLADYVLSFSDSDIIGEFSWNQTRGLNETFNIARGRYVDPSNDSLYQMVEYPQILLPSIDGIERVMTVDLPYVEDGRRAQRIAKQVLERNQYRGMFSATFNAKAFGCEVGDVVRLSFTPLGWTNKLFRVVSQEIRFDGQVPLALIEENAAIYAWDADDSAPITPTAPTIYDPLNDPFVLGTISASATADWSGVIDDDGNKPYDNADVTLDQPVVSKLDSNTGNAGAAFVSNDAFTFSQIVEFGNARDGDTVSFASSLPRVPQIIFLPGGNSATAGQNILIKANTLTTSGFTMIAKSQAVTAGSTITDTSRTAGGAGEPDYVINRTNSGNPFDGVYKYKISANISYIDMWGTPDPLYVTYYAKKSGAWVEIGSNAITGTGYYELETSPGTVDFGSGAEFGVSFDPVYGYSTGSFVQVKYTLGTVTETSLTPSSASSIPWLAVLD